MNGSMDPGHIVEWLLAFALTMAALAVVVAVARHLWRAWPRAERTVQLAALDAAVARHPSGSKLPGPRDVQAARWPDEDTGISDEQFSRELAEWLEGDGRG